MKIQIVIDMKFLLLPMAICCLFWSCDKKSKEEKAIEEIPVELKLERFDQAFFDSKPENLNQLKEKYPVFFPDNVEDAVWVEKMQHPQWRELYAEVQKKYKNFEPIHKDIEDLYRHIQFYFPNTPKPKVYTLISEMDYSTRAIYADSLIVIPLELYLGKDHKFYQFPAYIEQNLETKNLLPDIASSFLATKIDIRNSKTFIEQMIDAGKELYCKELLLPNLPKEVLIGYTPEQMNWCQENETYIWRYFIEKEILYSADVKLAPRFINPAPFSKFYLEIDNESPGQVGAWIGWQIVHSYMKNNEVTVTQLLTLSGKEIFEKSKYKPKK